MREPSCGLVHVSTDCPRIAAIAQTMGADVPYLRPSELASDLSTTMSVIEYALDFYEVSGQTFDYVLLAEPTSPLRRPGDFALAIDSLERHSLQFDTLVTVAPIANHPLHAKRIVKSRLTPFLPVVDAWARRQDLPPVFAPYTVAFVGKVAALRETQTYYGDRCLPLVLDRFQAYEIDDEYDFNCVEAVMSLALNRGYIEELKWPPTPQ